MQREAGIATMMKVTQTVEHMFPKTGLESVNSCRGKASPYLFTNNNKKNGRTHALVRNVQISHSYEFKAFERILYDCATRMSYVYGCNYIRL